MRQAISLEKEDLVKLVKKANPLKSEDLKYWDEGRYAWVSERGQVQLMIGAASNDIRLTGKIDVQ